MHWYHTVATTGWTIVVALILIAALTVALTGWTIIVHPRLKFTWPLFYATMLTTAFLIVQQAYSHGWLR